MKSLPQVEQVVIQDLSSKKPKKAKLERVRLFLVYIRKACNFSNI